MYIDFEDYRPETPRVEGALSGGTAVLISWSLHVIFALLLIFGPKYLPHARVAVPVDASDARNLEESPRFVFMQPRVDISKPQPKPNVEMSDQDRLRATLERAPDPKNALPYIRGNSSERVETEPRPPAPDPAQAQQRAQDAGRQNQPSDNQVATNDPGRAMMRLPDAQSASPALSIGRSGSTGILGDAIRNLQRYTQQQSFDNPQGSGEGQGLIQFDSKGVEFGPWLRRFVAQVKRNWFIPSAAMVLKGHVVITFNVHKDGAITDIEVKAPSTVDAFDRAAVNALIESNPTQPLPPEYPSERAFFTVTFLYNEMPPPGQ
jgi:TonB family protein